MLPSRKSVASGVILAIDVILGIAAGAMLALITAFVIIVAEDIRIQKGANGWFTTQKCGEHRSSVLLRAACAIDVAALNVPAEEVYWQAFLDGTRHRLDGRRAYVLHFPPSTLPPNSAAWSVTVGDLQRRMVDNPIHRYSVGSHSGLEPNADGSLDIYIQNTAPTGHESNWLPAPARPFMLWLRIYQPGPAILNGSYRPPPVTEATGGAK